EHFFIRKLDQAAAWVIAGHVFAAEFPQSGIEIPDVDYVACRVTNLYAITDAIRLANQNINPGDEAFHRRLYSQPDDDRTNTEGSDSSVPIHKNDRDDDDRDGQRDGETLDPQESETGRPIFDASNSIRRNRSRDHQDDRDHYCAAQHSLNNAQRSLRQW